MPSALPGPTARLAFRWWAAEDLLPAQQLWGDPQVVQLLDGDASAGRVAARLRMHLDFAAQAGVQYWPLFLRNDGAFVGCCGLRPPEQPGEYEMGFHLRPPYWSQGYGREAARAVLAHAFGPRAARTVWAGCHPHNAASQALLGKLGFRYSHSELLEHTGLQHPWYRLDGADYTAAGGWPDPA